MGVAALMLDHERERDGKRFPSHGVLLVMMKWEWYRGARGATL
jgi:hypothetical protein